MTIHKKSVTTGSSRFMAAKVVDVIGLSSPPGDESKRPRGSVRVLGIDLGTTNSTTVHGVAC